MAGGCWRWSMEINNDQRVAIDPNPARDLHQVEEIRLVSDGWLCRAYYKRLPPKSPPAPSLNRVVRYPTMPLLPVEVAFLPKPSLLPAG